MFKFQSETARRFRRGYAIRSYVGPNGSGKTACAVWDLLPSLDAGRPVLSTARLLDFRDPRPCDDESCDWPGHPDHGAAHPEWVPFVDFRQLLDFRDGDVFMDEVAGVASSRQSGALPFQVERDLQKLRHRGVTLSYTAPAWARTDKVIREVTLLLTHCTGMFPVVETGADTAWKRNRLLKWKSYDARELEKFTNSDSNHLDKPKASNPPKPVASQLFRIEGSLASLAYNSIVNETISLGWANEAGICIECGGRRSVPRCSCPSERGEHEHAAPASAEREDVAGSRRPSRPWSVPA